MICIDVGLYDTNCMLVSDTYTAELFRGLGDGVTTPGFMYLADFVPMNGWACASDPEVPPAGMGFFYQVLIVDGAGAPIVACGT